MFTKLNDFVSFVKTDGYKPVLIRLGTAVIAGRYICRLPMKVAIPVALAAMVTNWTIRWSGTPESYQRLKHVSIAITTSVALVKLCPQLLNRVWDIIGLWMLIFVAPTLVDKFNRLRDLDSPKIDADPIVPPPSPAKSESKKPAQPRPSARSARPASEPALELRNEAVNTFRKYFAKDADFGLSNAKKEIFVNHSEKKQTIVGSDRHDRLTVILDSGSEGLSLQVLHQHGEGELKQLKMKRAQSTAVLRILLPTQEDIHKALVEAAANITPRQAQRSAQLGKANTLLPSTHIIDTGDGRWWRISTKDELYFVSQLGHVAEDQQKVVLSSEVKCAWPGFVEKKYFFPIEKALYEGIHAAFEKFNQ